METSEWFPHLRVIPDTQVPRVNHNERLKEQTQILREQMDNNAKGRNNE